MKSISSSLFAPALLFVALSGGTLAQNVKVDLKEIKVATQSTPDIEADRVTEKKWKSRNWIEIEVDFQVDKKRSASDPSFLVDELLFKYYVAFDGKDPLTKQTVVGTANVTHINLVPKEDLHAVQYISPKTMMKVLNKDEASERDIVGVAVEVYYRGQLVAGDTYGKGQGKWWNQLPNKPDLLLSKKDTPFAPLWGDYHEEEKIDR